MDTTTPKEADTENVSSEEVWPPPISFPAMPAAKKGDRTLLKDCWRKTFFATFYLAITIGMICVHDNWHHSVWAIIFVAGTFAMTLSWIWDAVKAWLLLWAKNPAKE